MYLRPGSPSRRCYQIIRLSETDAITITDKIFQSANRNRPWKKPSPTPCIMAKSRDKDGNTIDDVYW